MTLYTVMDTARIWEGAWPSMPELKEVRIGGVLMQVEPAGDGAARIVRLLDCPLHRYLDASLAPGSKVNLPADR